MNYGRVFNSFQEMLNAKEEEAKNVWRFGITPQKDPTDTIRQLIKGVNKCKDGKCGDKKKPRGK